MIRPLPLSSHCATSVGNSPEHPPGSTRAAALALTRVLADLLYGVTALDPLTFAGVAALLAVVGIGASHLAARRAAAVDPLLVIRAE